MKTSAAQRNCIPATRIQTVSRAAVPPTKPLAEKPSEPADDQERAGMVLLDALNTCPDLDELSPAREQVWLAIKQEVCTTSPRMVRAFGSTRPVQVTEDHATEELITAWTWLTNHEAKARAMDPLELYVALRGAATRSATGSARAAQADLLHGLTEVPPGSTLRWGKITEIDAA